MRFAHSSSSRLVAFAVGVTALVVAAAPQSPPTRRPPTGALPAAARLTQKLPALRVPFVSAAQPDSRVAFFASTFAGTTYVTRSSEIVYALVHSERDANGPSPLAPVVISERFRGGRVEAPRGGARAATTVNILRGRNPAAWQRNLLTYDAVFLDSVYDGIDVQLKAYGGSVEKVFHVRPVAAPDAIRIAVDGAAALRVNSRGELETITARGPVTFTKPVAYQEIQGTRRAVDVAYAVDRLTYGFEVGAYDRAFDLVIDPVLAATYVGGSGQDRVNAVAADSTGNVYAAGTIFHPVIPQDLPGVTPASVDPLQGDMEGFVVKFDANLKTLVAATYLGGTDADVISALAIDASDNVYVGGATWSADFPGIGGASADSVLGGASDAFVARIDPTLVNMAATFVGGSEGAPDSENPGEMVLAMTFNLTGDLVLVGYTFSSDFPGLTRGSPDAKYEGYNEAFVATMEPGLSANPLSTFLGGESCDAANAVHVDPKSGDVYVGGFTRSTDFPFIMFDAADSSFDGESEAWVARLDPSMTGAAHATFLGGDDSFFREEVTGLETVGGNTVYVAGTTFAEDFPGVGPESLDDYNHDGDGFVAGLSFDLKAVQGATFIGGNTWDYISALDRLDDGTVFVAGSTMSFQWIPVSLDGYHGCAGGQSGQKYEAFIAGFDVGLHDLLTFKCLGVDSEGGAVASHGNHVYIGGMTRRNMLLVPPDAADATRGSVEGFVAHYSTGLNTKGFYHLVSLLQQIFLPECLCPDYLQKILSNELSQAVNHAQKSQPEAAAKAMLRFIARVESEIVAGEASAVSSARLTRGAAPQRGIPEREARRLIELARTALEDLTPIEDRGGRLAFAAKVRSGLRTVSRDCACQAATVFRAGAGLNAEGIPSCDACVRNVCAAAVVTPR